MLKMSGKVRQEDYFAARSEPKPKRESHRPVSVRQLGSRAAKNKESPACPGSLFLHSLRNL
jgi:hypothetical protein